MQGMLPSGAQLFCLCEDAMAPLVYTTDGQEQEEPLRQGRRGECAVASKSGENAV
jgi:hypothetical protein